MGPDEPRRRLLDYLNRNAVPIERRIAELHRRRKMRTSVAQDFTVSARGRPGPQRACRRRSHVEEC